MEDKCVYVVTAVQSMESVSSTSGYENFIREGKLSLLSCKKYILICSRKISEAGKFSVQTNQRT